MKEVLWVSSIDEALTRKGVVSRTTLRVGKDQTASPIEIDVLVSRGNIDGPRLWLQACLHGDEPGGMQLVHAFLESLDLSRLVGTIIAVPVGNPLAFTQRQRRSPVDDIDINRVFPGKVDGSSSEQFAHILWKEIAKKADFLIDIHAASLECHGIEHIIMVEGNDKAAQTARVMVEAFGPRIMWTTGGKWLGKALFSQFELSGRPGIIFDRGYIRDSEELKRHVRRFENIMAALGMLRGIKPRRMEEARVVYDPSWVPTPVSGVLNLMCGLGDEIKANQCIAVVEDLHGEQVGEVIAPSDGIVVSLTLHKYVHKGEQNQVALIG